MRMVCLLSFATACAGGTSLDDAGADAGVDAGPPSCTNIVGDRREQVCLRWNCDRMDLSEGTWSGQLAPQCVADDLTPAARANALRLINLYRFIAQMPEVKTDPLLDSAAQQCALMMAANNSLSHTPPTSWACYSSTGANAASQSNICDTGAVFCVDLYMADSGNASTLGHRRWLLSNQLGPIGIGGVLGMPGGSCHFVINGRGTSPQRWIAWPPPGPVPLGAIAIPGAPSVDTTGWSVQSETIDVRGALVSVTDNGQNKPVSVGPLTSDFGSRYAIKFAPNGWVSQPGHSYAVTVTPFMGAMISYTIDVVACP